MTPPAKNVAITRITIPNIVYKADDLLTVSEAIIPRYPTIETPNSRRASPSQ